MSLISRCRPLLVGLFVLLWFAAMHEYVYFIKDTYFRPEPAHAQDIINMNGPAFNPDFYKSDASLPDVSQLRINKNY